MAKRNAFDAGLRQSHRPVKYDPAAGKPYRATASIDPAIATAILEWSERSGRSIAWLLNEAVKNAPIDPETGLPTFLVQSPGSDSLPFDERRAS